MKSIWQDSADIKKFDSLNGEIKTDVLIIGGGIAGLLTAYMLKRAGVDCVVAEAERLCGGITQNTTAKITSQHGLIYGKLLKKYGREKAQLYLRANENALKKYRELCGETECCFEEKPAFVYSLDDRGKIESELAALEKIGFRAEFADSIPLPFRIAGAVKFPKQAQFNPLQFAAGIAEGLNVYEHTKVYGLTPHTAVTRHGKIIADKIIAATHFPLINKHGSYYLKMYQQRSYVLALENAPDIGGMYIDEAKNGLSFRNSGSYLLIGGGGHRTGKQGGGWRELSSFAYRHYPRLHEKYRWAAQDCMTLDGIPYIGQYSAQTPDFYVATGFNKWGMTSAMAAAMLLTDMITGKENEFAELFSPSRSMIQPQLAVNAFEAVSGLLSFSPKRCPHMGCALKWNAQEQTWDCPCHGSRFDRTGKLIDNPAAGNLK